MSDDPGGRPKFPGDLTDHLGRPEPPDRWADRLRSAWFLYALLAIAVPAWVAAIVWAASFGGLGWIAALSILTFPLAVYGRILAWRQVTGDRPERKD